MRKNKGFTLLEILIVLGIMSTLLMMGLYFYPSAQKKARDAQRKADLNNVRAALELYRSKNSFYPTMLSQLTEEKLYLESIPDDSFPNQDYSYTTTAGCDNLNVLCNDFTLGAKLEIPPNNICSLSLNCGSPVCNYCVGPYGAK